VPDVDYFPAFADCRRRVACQVIAPSLVPVKARDKVKTDRRDSEKLARCFRGGDLTPVFAPTTAHEEIRDLVRTRADAQEDQQRARRRLGILTQPASQ
jgi:transposase